MRLGAYAQLLCLERDGGPVGVVGAHIQAMMPAQLLKTHPNVGLNLLHDMPKVQVAIGVGEGTGNEYFAALGHKCRCSEMSEGWCSEKAGHTIANLPLFLCKASAV